MQLADIRQKLAYNPNAQPTQKQATRTWLNSTSSDYQLALTLTIKQTIEIKNANGIRYKRIDRDEIRRIATHFTHKLNKQVFGVSAAKSGRKSLKYFVVIEGERTFKNLHIHMAIGGLDRDTQWWKFDELVRNAKRSVIELDEQHDLKIMDSGWMDYITKELGKNDTDNVLWELA
jgi:hypothetical protein